MSALQSLPENLSLLSPVGFRFLLNNKPNVQYFCQAANVPGISISTIPHATPLKTYPIGGDEVTFEELSIRFLIDENMKNWREIYDWIITIGIPNEEAQDKYRIVKEAGNLTTDATLTILTGNMNPQVNINFKDLFPVRIVNVASVVKLPASFTILYLSCASSFGIPIVIIQS
jgi:hypothetical protein